MEAKQFYFFFLILKIKYIKVYSFKTNYFANNVYFKELNFSYFFVCEILSYVSTCTNFTGAIISCAIITYIQRNHMKVSIWWNYLRTSLYCLD